MALGGKTLLRRENGIVFLRPPQATAFLEGRGARGNRFQSSSSSSSTSGCRHYPAEITFLPVVATSSFLPYLWETFPPPRELEEEEEEEDEDEDEGSGSLAGKGGDRDEVVKSLGRLKIIQGSSLRADALPTLKETSNLLPPAIAQGTDRSLAVLWTDTTRATVCYDALRVMMQWVSGTMGRKIFSRKLYAINDTDKATDTSSRYLLLVFRSYRLIFITYTKKT